ncbi:aspartyl-phosphate phosphatase Spo0E family protein [Virgibacillus doumboii]|uniref:aspartyl-phosphate phosphatase Spo0E family protein n=1 Tax=Virgibacillus doumboii TaxID=2697503 RepID=UPI0013DE9465|nr:aspartyl-phosphate phosphatase Spo0E family protein [Virgibacillus doumboii]
MIQTYKQVQYDLKTAISNKKKEMIELGGKYGLGDSRTIECSQELDKLLNKYQHVQYFLLLFMIM